MALYSSHTDERLVVLLKDSDEAALAELYDRYWEKMATIAYVRLGSADDAKEVVQEVFISLWQRREELLIIHRFHTYLSAAVSYKIFTLLAKQKKDRRRQGPLAGDGRDNSTQEWLDFSALQDELEKVVHILPEKCRLVFRLSREAGLTRDGIARQLNIAPKTVETHISRALRHLRSSLKLLFSLLG